MNKIIQINLEGQAISIDEKAYESLKNYLDLLEKHFKNTASGEEILSDIRSRLSELFSNKTKAPNTFINEIDVQNAIEVMGKPADLGIAGSEEFEEIEIPAESDDVAKEKKLDTVIEEAKQEHSNAHDNHTKKLFRDPDNKALGGVCSGLAAYFNIDISIVRIITVLLVLFGFGFPIPIYLILWAVIPEAKTTHDKFRMTGETPDIGEIADRIRNEAQNVADSLKKNSNVNSALDGIANIMEKIVKAVSKIFSAGILSVLVIVAMAICIALLANATGSADININGQHYAAPQVFQSSAVNWVFSMSLMATILVPILTICYAILQFIFNFASPINLKAIFIAWLVSLAILIGVSIYASNQINYHELQDFKYKMEEVNQV